MARLEACYFCGTAEGDLRAVTVTPRRRQDDPDAALTLTLCRSCEGKLERVLDGLFENVESRPRESTEADTDASEPSDEPAEDPEPVDRIDVTSSRSEGARNEGRRELFADPPEAGGSDPETAEEAGTADGDEEADAEILDDEPRVTARATANSREAMDGVSVEDYNSLMRLLQNREFPMPRDAFVDLAANAYDLGEETVETVLDAVIDQGTLAVREGDLVRPGDEESA
jgi:hypothetical protein